jgi:hypothetical protein
MLTSLAVAGLLGIIGTFAAVLWTVVLGVGGGGRVLGVCPVAAAGAGAGVGMAAGDSALV